MKTDSATAVRDYVLIEDLAADDRPREKAMRHGIKSLSNAELIAIIFGNGMKGKSVLTLSRELLSRSNGRLSELARKPIRDIIKKNPGIGPAKAISLAAAIELGMRCRDEIPQEKPRTYRKAERCQRQGAHDRQGRQHVHDFQRVGIKQIESYA